MDPITGNALLSAGTDLLGGLLGISAQNKANEANLKAVRETNALNEKLFHEQLAYQTSEREAAQEYNKAINQRSRFEEGGFNPYAMLGQFESGNTQAQSSPSPNAMQAGQIQPVDAMSKAVESVGRDFSQTMVNAAQADSINMDSQIKKIDLQYRAAEKISGIKNQLADIESKRSKTAEDYQRIKNLQTELEMQQENLDILRSTKSEVVEQQKARTRYAKLENESLDLQNKYQIWFNDFAKKRGDTELRQIQSIIVQNYASAGALNAEKILKELQQKGVKIDNYQKNKLNWLIRESQRLDNDRKRFEMRYPTYIHRMTGIPFIDTEYNVVKHAFEEGRSRGYGSGYNQGYVNASKH